MTTAQHRVSSSKCVEEGEIIWGCKNQGRLPRIGGVWVGPWRAVLQAEIATAQLWRSQYGSQCPRSPSWTASLWGVASRHSQQAYWLRPQGFLDLNDPDNGLSSLLHWVPGRTVSTSHSWAVSICQVQLYSEGCFHFEGLRTIGLWLYKPRPLGEKMKAWEIVRSLWSFKPISSG